MGLETGLFFARKGWLVGLLDRDLSLLNEAALLFDADTVFINQVDVTSPENLKPVSYTHLTLPTKRIV